MVSKEGHADSHLGHETAHRHWFPWKRCNCKQCFLLTTLTHWFVWFYGISTIVGYLMPNPVFTYISDIWFANILCRNKQLNDQTVLFQTIQFCLSQQSQLCPSITNNSIKHQLFVYTQLNGQTVLFPTIQFSISHLFAYSLNLKEFYLTHR